MNSVDDDDNNNNNDNTSDNKADVTCKEFVNVMHAHYVTKYCGRQVYPQYRKLFAPHETQWELKAFEAHDICYTSNI